MLKVFAHILLIHDPGHALPISAKYWYHCLDPQQAFADIKMRTIAFTLVCFTFSKVACGAHQDPSLSRFVKSHSHCKAALYCIVLIQVPPQSSPSTITVWEAVERLVMPQAARFLRCKLPFPLAAFSIQVHILCEKLRKCCA